MSHLDDAAALFARMSLQEQQEALGALGLPERLPKESREPLKVTPFTALISRPSRRKRQRITVTVSSVESPASATDDPSEDTRTPADTKTAPSAAE